MKGKTMAIRGAVRATVKNALAIYSRFPAALLRRRIEGRTVVETDLEEPSCEELREAGYVFGDPFGEIDFACVEPEVDLSLVVPVYNAEETVRRCLDSLLNQNTSFSYELVLVNDGSSDGTGVILDSEYAENPKVRIYAQENGGISRARNVGLSLARGRFVGFVDNDDWVESDYIETLMSVAFGGDFDVVKCGHVVYRADGAQSEEIGVPTTSIGDLRSGKGYNGYIWGGVQKRELWQGFGFPLGCWYEDMVTRSLVYRVARSFSYVGRALYHKAVTGKNASTVLWGSDNPRCLDQAYLFGAIVEKCRKLGIADDIYLLRVALSEYGSLMGGRVGARFRRLAFRKACTVVRGIFESVAAEGEDLTWRERRYLEALLAGDYDYYDLLTRWAKWQRLTRRPD